MSQEYNFLSLKLGEKVMFEIVSLTVWIDRVLSNCCQALLTGDIASFKYRYARSFRMDF